jgi:hypothetical protein
MLTATGTAGTIQGEANFTFDGTNAVVGNVSEATFTVLGDFTASSKSFDIPHPTKEGMRLKYGVLEGPEHGVYIRGVITSQIIDLPDYWTGLVHSDTITVQFTPIGESNIHFVLKIEDNKVYLDSQKGTIHAYFFIQAERKDVNPPLLEYTPIK